MHHPKDLAVHLLNSNYAVFILKKMLRLLLTRNTQFLFKTKRFSRTMMLENSHMLRILRFWAQYGQAMSVLILTRFSFACGRFLSASLFLARSAQWASQWGLTVLDFRHHIRRLSLAFYVFSVGYVWTLMPKFKSIFWLFGTDWCHA